MTEEVQIAPEFILPDFARSRCNLADASLGAEVVVASDHFFGPAERMLNPDPARFYPGRYDDHGKWMDGWETRRRRGPGHDRAIVRLAFPGRLHGVDLDTSFFTGNYPLAVSLDGCYTDQRHPEESVTWTTLLPPTPMQGNAHHPFAITDTGIYSHLRLNLFPDGGIARLRVYGDVQAPRGPGLAADSVDLCALENGGQEIAWNNSHYGRPLNLLKPGRGKDMGDGWETRRRREPGQDWCILRLGIPGIVQRVEVDTAHFKGNFPEHCSIQAAYLENQPPAAVITQSMFWKTLLPAQPLHADRLHTFAESLFTCRNEIINHVRLNIDPDGGISRLRLWGIPARIGDVVKT